MGTSLGISAPDARAILAYDRELFERFVRRLKRLPWREIVREREIGHHTLLGTLVHILNVHEAWLVYVVPGRGDELDALFRSEGRHPNASWKAFDEYARRVWTGVDATASGFTDRSLGRRVKAPWMPGTYTVRDAVMQTTIEETHHIGEIIGALWQMDAPPPSRLTWIELLPGNSPPRRRRAA
jgi:uncharacterized damage-inducible protein DinB